MATDFEETHDQNPEEGARFRKQERRRDNKRVTKEAKR
jgi:hypothetical protein